MIAEDTGMKHNKIIVILLAIALLIGTFISAAAAGRYAIPLNGDEETVTPPLQEAPATPHVGVTGLLVGTEYFELSLKVSAREFQTVGVVLSYNTEVLTPIVWSSGEKNEDGSPKEISIDPAANNSWNRPVVLPSRGADGLAGKPALSYLGYDQEQQEKTGRGYLYLGADTLQYGDLIGERVVTVRFRRETGAPVTMPEDPETDDVMDESFTVCLASEGISQEAIPGHPVLLTAQGENRQPQSYIHYRHILVTEAGAAAAQETAGADAGEGELGSTEEPAPVPETDCTLSFSFGGVESADSTGGSGDYAITFYDWDGRVIDAIAAPKNATDIVATWQAQEWIQQRLGNKAGYDFDNWIVVYENNDGEGLHAEAGSLTSRKSRGENDKLKAADIADFGDLEQMTKENSQSVLVQAVYVANTAVNNAKGEDWSTGETEARYKFDQPTFYQYGEADSSTGQYAVRCKAYRDSTIRADTPTVLAKVYTSAGMVTVKVDLENTDETDFEVVVPRSTERITYEVLDTYGTVNWTNGESRSLEESAAKASILKEGSFAMLMDEALNAKKSGSWSSDVNTQCFIDAGYTGVNNAAKLAAAQQALVNQITSLGGDRILTAAEANAALAAYGRH